MVETIKYSKGFQYKGTNFNLGYIIQYKDCLYQIPYTKDEPSFLEMFNKPDIKFTWIKTINGFDKFSIGEWDITGYRLTLNKMETFMFLVEGI